LIERSQPTVLNNEISYNRKGVFLDQASALVAANQILYNHENDLWTQRTSFSALKVDLNFFGPPAKVKVASSHPEQKSAQLAVLETPDHRGARKMLPLSAFTNGPPQPELSLMVKAAGPESAIAKTDTAPSAPAGTKPETEKKPETATAKATPAAPVATPAKPQGQSQVALDAFIEGVSAARKEDYPKAIGLLDSALAEPSREAEARLVGYCYLQSGELKRPSLITTRLPSFHRTTMNTCFIWERPCTFPGRRPRPRSSTKRSCAGIRKIRMPASFSTCSRKLTRKNHPVKPLQRRPTKN
jgi:hypothetical protein